MMNNISAECHITGNPIITGNQDVGDACFSVR